MSHDHNASLRDADPLVAHLIDRELVDRVHGAGCRLIAWTVASPRDIARLAALGVDGLCGNAPDAILAALSP